VDAGRQVVRVSYATASWQPVPRQMLVEGRTVRLGGFVHDDASMLSLRDAWGSERIDVLVISPDADTAFAANVMSTVSRPGRNETAAMTLAHAARDNRHLGRRVATMIAGSRAPGGLHVPCVSSRVIRVAGQREGINTCEHSFRVRQYLSTNAMWSRDLHCRFAGALTSAGVDEGRVVRVVDAPQMRPNDSVVAQLAPGDEAGALRAAARLNECDVVVIQHEFGIFGGRDGSDILALLGHLRVPSVVVLHTVLVETDGESTGDSGSRRRSRGCGCDHDGDKRDIGWPAAIASTWTRSASSPTALRCIDAIDA